VRTSVTTPWTNAWTAVSVSRLATDVVLLIASIRPDLFTRRPPPCSGIPSIKEGFGPKVKHCRCWSMLARKVSRKVARGQLCGDGLDAHTDVTQQTRAFGQESLRLQGFFSW
jgi:hypothetical protein